jgi:SulP family sulfate permease
MMNFTLKNLRGDIYGGITAAVVALPLAMAFGVASGVGPIAGLYGAIAVGFFAAVFGGTDSQVSGPTGPMTVVMGAIVAQYAHNLPEAFAIVFLGGMLQIVFGTLRLGRYISYTPYSVVSGFMSGIGVIIIIIQTLPFIGQATVPGGPVATLDAWFSSGVSIAPQALALGVIGLAIGIFWPKKLSKILPAPLAALIAGTLLALFVFTGAPIIGEVPSGLPDFILPQISLGNLHNIIQPAIMLALLGSIDSLLTSLVADSITRTRHRSDQELVGQGIGNMVAGLIGGLPGAGATMRTVVNVRAGGRTPISGALHALILLALVLGLGSLAENIPHAILAAILIKVGWDIIDWGYLKRLRHAPRDQALVMLITLTLTVFVDLIMAVAIGLIVSGFLTACWNETSELEGVKIAEDAASTTGLSEQEQAAFQVAAKGQALLVQLQGRISYASARELIHRVSTKIAQPSCRKVLFDFTDMDKLDTSAALGIEELIDIAQETDTECMICGLSGDAAQTMKDLCVLDKVTPQDVVPERLQALQKLA